MKARNRHPRTHGLAIAALALIALLPLAAEASGGGGGSGAIPQGAPSLLNQSPEAVAAQLSEQDETFRKTYDSLQAFRRDYRLWKNLGYLR